MSDRRLARTTYGSIEYPGPVSHHSVITRDDHMHQDEIDDCFNAPAGQGTVDFFFRRGSVPIKGHCVGSAKILVRIKKRRRKGEDEGGAFCAEVMGTIPQTVRFRSMADHRYESNPNGRIANILRSLEALDYDAFLNYTVPELDETFQDLDLQPPPVFSRSALPANYLYRNSAQSAIQEVQNPQTGELYHRYANQSREQQFGVQVIGHQHSAGDVPLEPSPQVQARMKKLKQPLVDKVKRVFQERPMWLRHSLLAQFDPLEVQELVSNRTYIACAAYGIGAGPFWKCYVRYGYDPCADPDARKYQRLVFVLRVERTGRTVDAMEALIEQEDSEEEKEELEKGVSMNIFHRQRWEQKQKERVEAGERQPLDPKKGYVFDGRELHADKPDYQLGDITDPIIRAYLDDPANVTDFCDPWSGWYTRPVFTLVRNIIKAKYVYIHENNREPPHDLCRQLIRDFEVVQRNAT